MSRPLIQLQPQKYFIDKAFEGCAVDVLLLEIVHGQGLLSTLECSSCYIAEEVIAPPDVH